MGSFIVSLYPYRFFLRFYIFKDSKKKNVITLPSNYTKVNLVTLQEKKKKVKKYIKKKKRKLLKKKKKPKKIIKSKKKVKKKKKKVVVRPKAVKNEDDFFEKLKKLKNDWKKEELIEPEIEDTNDISKRLEELQTKWDKKPVKERPERIVSLPINNSISIDSPNFSSKYLMILQESMNQNWTMPIWKSTYRGTKIVIVFFKIKRSGEIINIKVEVSSEVSTLDRSAKEAVENTTYLPPLPDDFTESSLGVHFRFEYNYD